MEERREREIIEREEELRSSCETARSVPVGLSELESFINDCHRCRELVQTTALTGGEEELERTSR